MYPIAIGTKAMIASASELLANDYCRNHYLPDDLTYLETTIVNVEDILDYVGFGTIDKIAVVKTLAGSLFRFPVEVLFNVRDMLHRGRKVTVRTASELTPVLYRGGMYHGIFIPDIMIDEIAGKQVTISQVYDDSFQMRPLRSNDERTSQSWVVPWMFLTKISKIAEPDEDGDLMPISRILIKDKDIDDILTI